MTKKIIIVIGVLLFLGVGLNLLLDLNKLEEDINTDNQGELYLENDYLKISKVKWGVSSNHTEIVVLVKKNNLKLKFNNSILVKDDKNEVIIYSEKIPENYTTNENDHFAIVKITDQDILKIRELHKGENLIEIVY